MNELSKEDLIEMIDEATKNWEFYMDMATESDQELSRINELRERVGLSCLPPRKKGNA